MSQPVNRAPHTALRDHELLLTKRVASGKRRLFLAVPSDVLLIVHRAPPCDGARAHRPIER